MCRIPFAFVLLLCLPLMARAETNPEINKPYHLQVICHFGRNHSVFTEVFKTRVKNEIRDSLQNQLGRMARVEIVDKRSPRLDAVLRSGNLGVLDSWHEISDIKLHFVLIDLVNATNYRIRTRQYDGLTGLASPETREVLLQEPDRELVGRQTVDMVLADFGIVGTVDPSDPGPEIDVAFRGLGLTSSPEHWVGAGDIFGVSTLYTSNGRLEGHREPWALLRVLDKPKGGVAHCRFVHRFADTPLGQAGIRTRFLKWSTTTAHLRLRLIDDQTRRPIIGQPITVSRDNFGPNPDEATLNTGPNGQVTSQREYHNVAFVEIHNAAGRTLSMIPVPILNEGVVECAIRGDMVNKDNAVGDLEMQKQWWLGRVNETRVVVSQLLNELTTLVNARNNEKALQFAQAGLTDLQAAITRHKKALEMLEAQARKAGLPDAARLAPAEQRAFEELTQWKKDLASTVHEIQNVLAKEKDPALKEALSDIEQAKLSEKQADYGKALDLYDAAFRALPEGDSKSKLQEHIDDLRRQWRIKSEAQREARNFIYDTWPKLTTASDLADNLDKARKAFEACKSAGDRLTITKLWLASAAQVNILAKEQAALSSVKGEQAEKKKKDLLKLSADLAAFYKDVNSFLSGK